MGLNDLLTDPDALKAHHKEVCRGLGKQKNENWSIRVHRAISWYRKAMEVAPTDSKDRDMAEARLLFLWISLNAFFGRWSQEDRRSAPEGVSIRLFLDELALMDRDGGVADCVGQSLASTRRLLATPFLHAAFWVNPFDPRLADRMALPDDLFALPLSPMRAFRILRESLDRVYLLRGQIVHGASTSGSRLNRTSLADSLRLLHRLVPAVINAVIQGGAGREWPPLCYPPVDLKDGETLRRL